MKLRSSKMLVSWYLSSSRLKHLLASLVYFIAGRINLYCRFKPKDFIGAYSRLCEIYGQMPLMRTYMDLLTSFFVYGYLPYEYVSFGFLGKEKAERHKYVSDSEMVKFASLLNDWKYEHICNNKSHTYEFFKPYYRRMQIQVRNSNDRDAFNQISKGHSILFAKPIIGYAGNGARMIHISQENLNEIFDNLISRKGGYVLEEPIEQCPEMSSLSSDSVNTVRYATIFDGKTVRCLYTLLRCGRKGACVDNIGAGGICVAIDVDTGKTIPPAFGRNGGRYEKHPDTGVDFSEFVVPRWNELKMLADQLARKLPQLRYLGWDFAITKNGVILVEANATAQMGGFQILKGEGQRNNLKKILTELFEEQKV